LSAPKSILESTKSFETPNSKNIKKKSGMSVTNDIFIWKYLPIHSIKCF